VFLCLCVSSSMCGVMGGDVVCLCGFVCVWVCGCIVCDCVWVMLFVCVFDGEFLFLCVLCV